MNLLEEGLNSIEKNVFTKVKWHMLKNMWISVIDN